MDTATFYALFSTTCFALVGLWWNAVAQRPQRIHDSHSKRSATGVYLSFLIPGMMGLGAQVTGADNPLWRGVFVVGAAIGLYVTAQAMRSGAQADAHLGFFNRNRWIVAVIYASILLGSLGLDYVATFAGFTPIQVEAGLMCLLVLAGHGLSWEVLMDTTARES